MSKTKSDVCQDGNLQIVSFFKALDMSGNEIRLIPSDGNLYGGFGDNIYNFGPYLKMSGEYEGRFYRLNTKLAVAYTEGHKCKGNDNDCKASEFNRIKKENIEKINELKGINKVKVGKKDRIRPPLSF
jgi:hypothetical protein